MKLCGAPQKRHLNSPLQQLYSGGRADNREAVTKPLRHDMALNNDSEEAKKYSERNLAYEEMIAFLEV